MSSSQRRSPRLILTAAAALLALAACSGQGQPAAPSASTAAASPSPSAPEAGYYDQAPDNDPAAARKCAGLGVGEEVYALVGRTTLASQLPAASSGISCTFFLPGRDPQDKTFATRDSISVTLQPGDRADVERNAGLITAAPPVTRLTLGEDAWWWAGSTVPSIANGQCEVLSEGQVLGVYFVSLAGRTLLTSADCSRIARKVLGL